MRPVIVYIIALAFMLIPLTGPAPASEEPSGGATTVVTDPQPGGEPPHAEVTGGPSNRANVTFTNVSEQTGLAGVGGSFLAWGDYDRDGYEDILVNGRRLFRNTGPPLYHFSEVTSSAGLGGSGAANGVWGDYDNDGDLDFFGGNWQDYLYRNDGDGTFTDVAEWAGVWTPDHPTTAGGWGDYDDDGHLDLYTTGGEWVDEGGTYHHYPDTLFHNNGDGTFTNVTETAGVDSYDDPRYGRGVEWCDFDADGDLDVYISNYRIVANYLWRNNGDGTFSDVALDLNVGGEPTNRLGNTYYGHTVGSAWSDYDNDGDFDLWATNLAHKDLYRGPICDDSELYRYDGYDFTNVREETGIPVKGIGGGEDELMVGVAWGDYDNDGYDDLFLPQIYDDPAYAYSYLYHNNGDGTFSDVSDEVGVKVWNTYAGCFCDYDLDGDLDLLTSGKGVAEPGAANELHLYRNEGGNRGDWLQLELEGDASNADAVGAQVVISSWAGSPVRQVEGGMGCHGMKNSHAVHFGLGHYDTDGDGIKTVDIRVAWPSGVVQTIEDVPYPGRVIVPEPEPHFDLEVTAYEGLVDGGGGKRGGEYLPGDDLWSTAMVTNTGSIPSETTNLTMYLLLDPEGEETEGADAVVEGYGSLRELDTTIITPLSAGGMNWYDLYWQLAVEPGDYTIVVLAYPFSDNESDTGDNGDSFDITVIEPPPHENEPPVPALTASPSSIMAGEEVTFDASGSYDDVGVVSYRYDFGDGGTLDWTSADVITHIYLDPGEFTAALTVRDTDGVESAAPAEAKVSVSTEAGNHAPVLLSLEAGRMTVDPGNSTTVTATAEDSDGDDITFGIKATSGELGSMSQSGGTAMWTWTAPDRQGDCVITASASDGELESLSRSLTITVDDTGEEPPEEGPGSPPSISLISVDPEMPYTASKATIAVTASDPDGDPLDYEYDVSGGTVSGTGSAVTWYTPEEAGRYNIEVEVSDGRGYRDREKVYVEVVEEPLAPKVGRVSVDLEDLPADDSTEVVLTAGVEDPNGWWDLKAVMADLSALGLGAVEMADNGRGEDDRADDGTYTLVFTVPDDVEPGSYTVKVTATDIAGMSDTEELTVGVVEGEKRSGSSSGGDSTPGFAGAPALVAAAVAAAAAITMAGRRRRS